MTHIMLLEAEIDKAEQDPALQRHPGNLQEITHILVRNLVLCVMEPHGVICPLKNGLPDLFLYRFLREALPLKFLYFRSLLSNFFVNVFHAAYFLLNHNLST